MTTIETEARLQMALTFTRQALNTLDLLPKTGLGYLTLEPINDAASDLHAATLAITDAIATVSAGRKIGRPS